jgi:hypothetical protein
MKTSFLTNALNLLCAGLVCLPSAAYAFAVVGDSDSSLNTMFVGQVRASCTPSTSYNVANASDVFGPALADKLPIPSEDIAIYPLRNVKRIATEKFELNLFKDPNLDDSIVWVTQRHKLKFHSVLKGQRPASVSLCKVFGRDLAFVETGDNAGNTLDLYIFNDDGVLVTTIKGSVRFNEFNIQQDSDGRYLFYGTGLRINGAAPWNHPLPPELEIDRRKYLTRLNRSSISPDVKIILSSSLSGRTDGAPEHFFPYVHILTSAGEIVDAPKSVQNAFYLRMAEESFADLIDEHSPRAGTYFSHALTIPIFVRLLGEVGLPGYAKKKWQSLPTSIRNEIDLSLLIEFWRTEGVPEVAAAFLN